MALVQGCGFRNQYETKRLCVAVLIVSHKCNWVGYLNTKQKEGFFVFKLITFLLDLSNAETTSLYAQKVFEHTRA